MRNILNISLMNLEDLKPASSLAFKNGFLGIPVVDIWAKEMAKLFLKKFQTLTFKRNDYTSLITIDIDQPFAFLG